jgi:transposase-like protein
MTSALSAKHLHDEAAAYKWVEARVWPDGRVCPHCGVLDNSGPLKGKSTRIGVYKCYVKGCRKPFTVKVGTIFESSHVKLHIWLQAMHIMASSKKGFSSNQFARVLGVDLKTAWFMSHRIRLAMAPGGKLPPMGGEGKVVEVDETYHGKVSNPTDLTTKGKPFKNKKAGRGGVNKRPIIALVERGGQARTFHVAEANLATVAKIVRENIDPKSRLHTDGATMYIGIGREFAEHGRVDHSMGEYVRYEENGAIHNNSCEGYFSVFKRGMKGVYQHCSEKHLHRYLAEYEFRFNNRIALGIDDHGRADKLLAGVVGKRLTYRTANGAAV